MEKDKDEKYTNQSLGLPEVLIDNGEHPENNGAELADENESSSAVVPEVPRKIAPGIFVLRNNSAPKFDNCFILEDLCKNIVLRIGNLLLIFSSEKKAKDLLKKKNKEKNFFANEYAWNKLVYEYRGYSIAEALLDYDGKEGIYTSIPLKLKK